MNSASRDTSNGDSSFADRRASQRIPARFEVRFQKKEHAARAFRAWSVNVSAGGLALKVSNEYAVGEKLALSLTVEAVTYEVDAVVAWTRGEVIGVRFEPAEDALRLRLEKLAESFRAKLAQN